MEKKGSSMEKDLFGPIKEYFKQYGYVCDGEVEDIDLYMEKEDKSVAVELKVRLDFKAVIQAALRQKITDIVFIGIYRPKDLFSRSFQNKIYLLKRLGIGLMVVSKRTGTVEIVSEPEVSELSMYQQRNGKKKESLEKEFRRRKVKSNTGGVHRTKLITGYREDALLVLDALMELGGKAPTKEIRELSRVEKTTSILYDNYYGWFEHEKKGVYSVREAGLHALEEFEETLAILKKQNKNNERKLE